MSVELPKGAGTQQPGENDLSNAADQYQPDPQIASQLMEEGYGDPTDDFEFPNLPEISNMGDDAPGFFERVIPNFKAIMTSDDLGKTEIFQEAFKDDPRWGGAFVDKFGNPIIVWNRVPYYVNKPGLSGTDMASFTGEVLKYIPASKFVAKAKTAKDTVMRGLGAYTATETVSKIGEAAITPETVEARDQSLADVAKETGLITGIGVGAMSYLL